MRRVLIVPVLVLAACSAEPEGETVSRDDEPEFSVEVRPYCDRAVEAGLHPNFRECVIATCEADDAEACEIARTFDAETPSAPSPAAAD